MFKSLQACRAIAAALVVLFHVGGTIALPKYSGIAEIGRPFSFGHAGVDFFFVLSGFIILWAHRKDIDRPETLGRYVVKRAIRIFPMYWVTFLVVYGSARLIPSIAQSVPHDLPIFLKALFLVPQPMSEVGGTGAPVLIVAWSLHYEMLFYVVFSCFILNSRLGWLAVLGLVTIYFASNMTATLPWSFIARETWLWLFAMGALVALIVSSQRWTTPHPGIVAALGAMGYLLVAGMDVARPAFSIGIEWHLLYGVASALMVLGLVELERRGRVIGSGSLVQMLGASSFVLYLIHFPMVSLLCKALKTLGLLESVGGAMASFLLITLACVSFAVPIHLWIEAPLLRKLSNRVSRPAISATAM